MSNITSLDGLRAFFRMSPFMVDLGVEPVGVGEGRVSTTLPLATRHLQHTGQCHAGVMASLADHSMGAAAQTLLPPGQWAITAELKVSALRPGRGERLVCEAVVIKGGRSLSFTEAEVWAEGPAGRTLVLKASATMAIVAGQA
jgi:uncharacterized protein (TIGR00369 family)